MTQKLRILLLILMQAAKEINQMPISVPVDNYPDISGRFPTAYYNRLPGNRYPIKNDPVNDNSDNNNGVTDEYEDYEDQSDKPVTNAQYTSSSNYNSNGNNNNFNYLLTENRIKYKRRRKKIRRPCIPIQSFNSPLFSNRIKRESDKDSGKTLGLLFGNRYPFAYPPPIGTPFYGNYYGGVGGYPNRPYYDNVKPQYDNDRPQYDDNRPQYDTAANPINAPLYNPVGGYPCVPVSYGHVPNGGPFGFFGQGGLLDFGASPSINVPQTVIINRPPLFGNKPPLFGNKPNKPFYNRPQYGEEGGIGSGAENDGTRPEGFWGTVVDKLSEFVTSVSPQAVYSAIGDTLQNLGNAIQNAQPATAAVDTIRNGYREFTSLIFR